MMLSPCSAEAEIYKQVDKFGHITFTDKPSSIDDEAYVVKPSKAINILPSAAGGLVARFSFNGEFNNEISGDIEAIVKPSIYFSDGYHGQGLASNEQNENVGAQLTIKNPFDREYFTISYWNNPVVDHNKTYGGTNVAVWHGTDRDKRSFGLVTSSGNHRYYHKHEYPELIVSDAVNNNRQGTSLYYAEEQLRERRWQYVALVYAQGEITVYINGNSVIAGKATTVSPTGNLF